MGTIEVIAGCMFSGKSEELIRRLKRCMISRKKVLVFKHTIDERWNRSEELVSRNGASLTAIRTHEPSYILARSEEMDIVGIDEAHFYDKSLIGVIEALRQNSISVIITGLDMDFRGEPFGIVPQLMAIADRVDKLDAVCMLCGERATQSQRLVDGKPAQYGSEQLVVGDEEYQARCRKCHEVPGREQLRLIAEQY
ncbi:MAG: thymidine kinase [Patescibacteria group bacterium]